MKTYIGAKIIQAEPMDENTFISKFGHKETKDQQNQPGYHVVYPNPEGEYHSWSPEKVFENAYREVLDGETQMILDMAPTDTKQLEDERAYLISAIKDAKIEGLLEPYDIWRSKRTNEPQQ